MPSGCLRELVRVGEKIGLEDCKVLSSAELASYGVKCFGENA